jgi:hypothetical protein
MARDDEHVGEPSGTPYRASGQLDADVDRDARHVGGAFWIAYGILHLLGATGALTLPTDVFPELG